MPRVVLDKNVFDAALDRMIECYQHPENYPVVSFSAGKDSGICLELAILAATMTNRLPVDVVMRDEEVMFPGTFEYAERMAIRPEVRMHWVIARQPVVNNFNRRAPYFWVFDEQVAPNDWVRLPPGFTEYLAELPGAWDLNLPIDIPVNTRWTPAGWANGGYVKFIEEKYIEAITVRTRFHPYIQDHQGVFDTVGLRGQESFMRLRGVYASGGHLTKANRYGTRKIRPIYDWTDGDVWKAILEGGGTGHQWDYNEAYNVMLRMGTKRKDMRIAPPTMNPAGANALQKASRAWPRWFDRVSARLPGSRSVAQFGLKILTPERRTGETWQSCFQRECITNAPPWIAERATIASRSILRTHAHHDNTGILPELVPCQTCGEFGSWNRLARLLYLGDPFSQKAGSLLPVIEPEFFREGAGTWGGTPTFS